MYVRPNEVEYCVEVSILLAEREHLLVPSLVQTLVRFVHFGCARLYFHSTKVQDFQQTEFCTGTSRALIDMGFLDSAEYRHEGHAIVSGRGTVFRRKPAARNWCASTQDAQNVCKFVSLVWASRRALSPVVVR